MFRLPRQILNVSATAARRARRGISLIEVTFAIGVVTVGLLGVIALLPLAAHHARQGDITDRGAVLGLSALEELDMRGYRRPDMWLVWSPISGQETFTSFRPGPGHRRWSVYDYVNNGYVSADSITGAAVNGATFEGGMVQAFCIDPRFLNANVTNLRSSPEGRFFPYYPPRFPAALPTPVPRMTRITVKASPALDRVLSVSQADAIFVSEDDLSVDLPEDANVYSQITGFNEGADGGWGVEGVDDDGVNGIDDYGEAGFVGSDDVLVKRTADGKFSWMATLAPKLDLTGASRTREEYTLSVVVFHNRDAGMVMDDKNEAVANVATFLSGGYGGGEVILEAIDTNEDEHIFGEMRPNTWIMLAADSIAGPMFRWYRISSADQDQSRGPSLVPYNNGDDVWRRQITLEGADWSRPEWQGTSPAFRTQATLVAGVVAVYEKTVRLESSSLWNQ